VKTVMKSAVIGGSLENDAPVTRLEAASELQTHTLTSVNTSEAFPGQSSSTIHCRLVTDIEPKYSRTCGFDLESLCRLPAVGPMAEISLIQIPLQHTDTSFAIPRWLRDFFLRVPCIWRLSGRTPRKNKWTFHCRAQPH